MALGTSWGLSAKSCRPKLPPAVARPVALYPVCHNTRECGREQDGSGTWVFVPVEGFGLDAGHPSPLP